MCATLLCINLVSMAFAKNLIPEVLKCCLRRGEFSGISCWICHTAAHTSITHWLDCVWVCVCECEQVLIHHNTQHLPYHMPPTYPNLKPATVSRGTHNFHLCFVWKSGNPCQYATISASSSCFFIFLFLFSWDCNVFVPFGTSSAGGTCNLPACPCFAFHPQCDTPPKAFSP